MTATRRFGLALAGLACVLLISFGVAWAEGYRVYVIHTGSMEPAFPLGTAVIDRPPGRLKPGDVITFRHSNATTDVVTHRIVDITAQGIDTKGDANNSNDPWVIRPDQVKGQELVAVPRLGYLLVFLQQPAGIASTVMAPLALFLLWALFFPGAEPVRRRAAHRASRYRAPHDSIARDLAPSDQAVAAKIDHPRRMRGLSRDVPAVVNSRRDDQPTAIMSRSDIDALHALLDA